MTLMNNLFFKRYFYFFLGFFFFIKANSCVAQDTQFDWAYSAGGFLIDVGSSICSDSLGNTYATGLYTLTVDIDFGPDTFNLNTIGSTAGDGFIQKNDPNGHLIWAKQIDAAITNITIDREGNLYVVGGFKYTVDFDPGPGVYQLFANSTDAFILKLDTAGNFVWARDIGGGSDPSLTTHVAVDDTGNVFITGYVEGTVDLDPGPATLSHTTLGYTNNATDIFIEKLDSAGNLVWVQVIGNDEGDISTSLCLDSDNNVYVTGYVTGIADFDAGPDTSALDTEAFVLKLKADGTFQWVKGFDCGFTDMYIDSLENLTLTGRYRGTVDFDPGPGTVTNQTYPPLSREDVFLLKLDSSGGFVFFREFDMLGVSSMDHDNFGNTYLTGRFQNYVDFDPGPGVSGLNPSGTQIYLIKLDFNGNFQWVKALESSTTDYSRDIHLDIANNIYLIGSFENSVDFDPSSAVFNMTSNGSDDYFLLKLGQDKIVGQVYQDLNQNCVQDSNEIGLSNRILIINPGNIVTTTNHKGEWSINNLAIGNYTVTIDSSGTWASSCFTTQTFSVTNSQTTLFVPSFGLYSTNPCPAPDLSIHAPFLRPGFSNQRIYLKLCNQQVGTDLIHSPYIIVELDSLLIPHSSAWPNYIDLGNNQYQINLSGSIAPGFCTNYWMDCYLDSNAILGQTLCMSASLYPVDSCYLDSIPSSPIPGISPCNTLYDGSHLLIRPACNNDTISFVIYNTGDGDMSCYSQVRLFIDGQIVLLDSVQLLAGDTAMFNFLGDGRTWRMEVDQHPLHPGNSQPSASIELCGNAANWTSNLVNLFPHNDADPMIDIYCGPVVSSYDPNDKKGFPLGVDSTHDISANQELEYLIRFQNTGTAPAINVVIRDTLSTDLDIFSLRSGVSSHSYEFSMYGPRIIEWRFNNIMLPDSNTNEPASHGFIKFKVKQAPNLAIGTVIENTAAIYFDLNLPIITNTTFHTIAAPQIMNWDGQATIVDTACFSYTYNSYNYTQSGTYFQTISNNGLDSFYTLDLDIISIDNSLSVNATSIIANANDSTLSYQWLDCDDNNSSIIGENAISYTPLMDGNYAVQISNGDCQTTSACKNFVFNAQTLVYDGLKLSVYPNPVGEILYVESNSIYGSELQLINNLGQIQLKRTLNGAKTSIDMSSLPTGIYFLHIRNKLKSNTIKIVKQ